MSRKLASIVTISKVSPIENADRLEVAEMVGKGWKVVTQKGEFKPGDHAVYFEIDAFLPPNDERYAFLRERCLRKFVSKAGNVLREGIRIKTVKLRGVLSQGLLIPLANFNEITSTVQRLDNGTVFTNTVNVAEKDDNGNETFLQKQTIQSLDGADVTALLHVEHYDEVKEQLAPMTGGGNPVSADAYGKFPSDYIPKTDEERIQNLGEWFETKKGIKWELTEKNDGSSITFFYSPTIDAENPFGVCSRNLRLKPMTAKGVRPLPWLMADKYGIEAKLKEFYEHGFEFALQGELVGPGVNGDRDKYNEHEWHCFKIYDIRNQRYVLPAERRAICTTIKIPHVHVIADSMPVFDKFATCEELLNFAEGKTIRGNEREGIVFKSTTEPSISFKAVSNRYLLKQED